MRTVVSLPTAFATVIHFSFGCCLHASHAQAGHDCGVDTAHAAIAHLSDEAPADEAEEHCDCHGAEDDDAGGHHHDQRLKAAEGAGVASKPERDGHDCGGCDCVADATAADQSGEWRPLDSGLDAALDARDLAAASFASRRASADGDPPPRPDRHSLYERLLV